MADPVDELANAVVTVDVDVRFAETDSMGVVHHANYVVWFEVGRVAWMKAAGMPYTEIAASGHHLAVTAIHAEYRASSALWRHGAYQCSARQATQSSGRIHLRITQFSR